MTTSSTRTTTVDGTDPRAAVAACTAQAAHRRDHDHTGGRHCLPHAVEVVHLGQRALVVCHDCRTDSGFGPGAEAERVAQAHRRDTARTGVPLPRSPL